MAHQPNLSDVLLPKEVEVAKQLVTIMDDAINIPIVNKRIGLDPIIGLVPWVGDMFTAFISLLIVVSLVRNGAPVKLVLQMLVNIAIDLFIGGIPVVGDVWDFFFRSNRRNLKLLIDHHSQF